MNWVRTQLAKLRRWFQGKELLLIETFFILKPAIYVIVKAVLVKLGLWSVATAMGASILALLHSLGTLGCLLITGCGCLIMLFATAAGAIIMYLMLHDIFTTLLRLMT